MRPVSAVRVHRVEEPKGLWRTIDATVRTAIKSRLQRDLGGEESMYSNARQTPFPDEGGSGGYTVVKFRAVIRLYFTLNYRIVGNKL